jgi:hypothetical protein
VGKDREACTGGSRGKNDVKLASIQAFDGDQIPGGLRPAR